MEALLQKKKQWEYQNQQVLIKLAQISANVSVESVKAAGLLTSFLLYLIYIGVRGMLVISAILFRGPRLIRRVGPHHRPERDHQLTAAKADLHLGSRLNRILR